MQRGALRLLVAVAVAWLLGALVIADLPRELHVRTDIVGYPAFADFNIARYLWSYAVVVMMPLLALAAYVVLTRWFVGKPGPRGPIPPPSERVETLPAAAGRGEIAVTAGRVLLAGLVLALEASTAGDHPQARFTVTLVGYGALVALAGALVASRRGGRRVDAFGAVNTLAALLVVPGLFLVSESTKVTVAGTGAAHEYPWLPAWLASVAAVCLLVVVSTAWSRARGVVERRALERRVVLLVVAPVGLFVVLASLPGALGTMDFFEEGQVLAGSDLVRGGAFPWRDVLLAHGVLHDVVGGLVGTEVFEDSRWGAVAGQTLLLVPFAWLAQYYLCVYLVGDNWVYLLGTQLLIVTGLITEVEIRFLLLPLVVLLLVALLRRPTALRAAAFTTLLALQVVVTPEATTLALACVGTLAVFELYYHERGRGLRRGFRRVWLCAASGAAVAVCWMLFLALHGALDDWLFSFTTLVRGHELTGGIPLLVSKTRFEVVAPVVLVLAALAIVVARTRLRRPLAFQDWAMIAMAILTMLYYPKFLSRADIFHLAQSFSVAVPLLFYLGYRGITAAEAAIAGAARRRRLEWLPARHTIAVPLFALLVLVHAPLSIEDVVRSLPHRFSPAVPREPVAARIGFDWPGENDTAVIRDVVRETRALLRPGDTVFDFSNSPGLFHYLADLPPATRYYHVSLALRQSTQEDLIRRLQRHRPAVVVLTGSRVGLSLPAWDGISNQVRHYDVSRYLLRRYVPVAESHGFVLMAPQGSGRATERGLYFDVPPCDWGFVPNFFAPEPAPSAAAARLSLRPIGGLPARTWALRLPEGASWDAYSWLELRARSALARGEFTLADRARATHRGRRTIDFGALGRGETALRVLAGSCSQWHGYEGKTLYLRSSVPQDLKEVRLLR